MNRRLLYILIATLTLVGFVAWRDSQQSETPDLVLAKPSSDVREIQKPNSIDTTRAPVASRPEPFIPQESDTDETDSLSLVKKLSTHEDSQALAPGNLFPSQTWQAPQAPPSKVVASDPTALPPIPFEVGGQWLEGSTVYVLLTQDTTQYLLCNGCTALGHLQPGDILPGQYRIDKINTQAIELTYLPSKKQQTLALGAIQ